MAGIFWSGFDKAKLKSHLLMSLERFKLQTNRRRNEMQAEKREIAVLLRDKQYDRARIKVESVIRKDRERQACEILETMVDLIVARVTLIASEKACSLDMQESVHTVMWASKRVQVEELHEVRAQLALKYGDAFAAAAMRGEGPGCHLNARVRDLLTVSVPGDDVKLHYLTEIAAAQNVPFDPKEMARGGLLPAMLPSALGPPPATDLPCCGEGGAAGGAGGAGASGGAGCSDPACGTSPGGDAPSIAVPGTGQTATVITNSDGSTTIVLAPTGSTVIPTGTGTHGHGHGGDHHGHGGGGGHPGMPVPSASGLPPGVILDPFSQAGGGMPTHPGGYFPSGVTPTGTGMMMPPVYGMPYGAPMMPPMMPPGAYYPAASGGYTMPMGVSPGTEPGYPDGKPGMGAIGVPPMPSPTTPAVISSPGYTYGAAPQAADTNPASSSSVHSASASASRVTGVLNPEDDDSATDGSGTRGSSLIASGSASHHRVAMPPTRAGGSGASPAASGLPVGHPPAFHSEVPDKGTSGGGHSESPAATGGPANPPSMEVLAARFAALRASRE